MEKDGLFIYRLWWQRRGHCENFKDIAFVLNAFVSLSSHLRVLFFPLFVLVRLYKYRNPTLRFDRLQTRVRIYRPPAKVSSSMDHVVTQASSIPSSEFSRKIPRQSVSHTTTLAGTSKEEDWIGTNTRKVYNCVSKDLNFRKRGWVCESSNISWWNRHILFLYFSYVELGKKLGSNKF